MAGTDSSDGRKRVLDAMFQHVQTNGGPPLEQQFEADQWDDERSLRGLLDDGVVFADLGLLKWGATALAVSSGSNAFVAQELVRAKDLVRKLRQIYRQNVRNRITVASLFSAVREDAVVTWNEPNEVRRGLMVMTREGLLDAMNMDTDGFAPFDCGISRAILRFDENTEFKPRPLNPPRPTAPAIPANAIDGRWLPTETGTPREGGNGVVRPVKDLTGEFKELLAMNASQ